MKKIIQLVALMLAALFILTACNSTPAGPNDDTMADTTLGDVTDTTTGGGEAPPETPEDPEEDTRWGVAVNVDPDAIYNFINTRKFMTDGEWDVTDLESKAIEFFNDRYQDCGISDILYNLANVVPYVSDDTEILFDRVDKYYATDDNGRPVDNTTNAGALSAYLVYETTDVDPYKVWFEQCRLNGINPWLSFRMNDVHSANEAYGHSPFHYTARENGWQIGKSRSSYWETNSVTIGSRFWYPEAYNYAIPQVREKFLKEIEDRLSTYDCYGIELDWQRSIWSFPTDDIENCKYINEFMEDVNEIVEKYEGIYGHDIKIAVRINRDIDENKYFGFDTRYWGQQGWADIIIPASYWGSTDSDMPIEEWISELSQYGMEIWPGLECHIMNNSWWFNIPTLAGYTAQYLSQGGAKIYLYNLFNAEKSLFKVCESLETALSAQKRSYIVTESNCTPYNVPGITQWDPLPIRLQVGNVNDDIVINHGTLNYSKETVIYVALAGVSNADLDKDTLVVKYNGVECEYDGISKKSYLKEDITFGTVVAYKIPKDAVNGSLKGEITFDAGVNVTITYIELMNGNSRLNL